MGTVGSVALMGVASGLLQKGWYLIFLESSIW